MMETPAVNKIILLLSITMFQYLPSFPLIYNNIFFEQNKEEFAVFVYFFVFFKATNEKKEGRHKSQPSSENIRSDTASDPKNGDGGIRTLEPVKANAFRVRPVMTASIRLH